MELETNFKDDAWDDVEDMLRDIENYSKNNRVKIFQEDRPLHLRIGYRSEDGKTWSVKISVVKKTNINLVKLFASEDGKKIILNKINGVA